MDYALIQHVFCINKALQQVAQSWLGMMTGVQHAALSNHRPEFNSVCESCVWLSSGTKNTLVKVKSLKSLLSN